MLFFTGNHFYVPCIATNHAAGVKVFSLSPVGVVSVNWYISRPDTNEQGFIMNVKGEIIISGATVLIACILLYVATTFTQLLFADQVGPAFWPKTILIAVIVLSGFLFIKNILIAQRDDKIVRKEDSAQEREGGIRLVMAIILSLVYAFSVPYVGFLISIILFQVLFLLILKVKKALVLAFFPLSLTLILYIIFIKVLYIPLPRGTGVFLTFSRIFY
ncbi:MAG: tripartite tricarboxylate transporter TctB family protein [Deltaproteobacteria bacterium]|nr:tripartite tricarboxylate transporter TctB family protein [Deltaproteobacteria bacterium]